MAEVVVRDMPEEHRYVAVVDGTVAGFIDYRDSGPDRVLRHTEVSDAFEGQGVGSALARSALDDARASGRRVRPTCPFVAGWLQRHPEYLELVRAGH